MAEVVTVAGYIGKAAAALHPGDPQAAREWADGQLLRVLHGRAQPVAVTLKSVAAKTRAKPGPASSTSPTSTRRSPT